MTRSEPRKRKTTFDIEAEELDRWVQSDYDDMVIVRDQNEKIFYGQKLNLKLGNGPKSKEIHNTNIELALELLRAKNTIELRKSYAA